MNSRNSSRRRFLTCACSVGLASGSGLFSPASIAAGESVQHARLAPAEALEVLRKGNEAYFKEDPVRAAQGHARRLEIARSQTPLAVLVGCSDSRVPPELLFGRGLGELFIVRNAGNTVDNVAEGSIEYGVSALGVSLIVVLGHERCGAVEAAVDVVERNAVFPSSIAKMIEPIIPAVLIAKAGMPQHARREKAALVEASVRENVRRVATQVRAEAFNQQLIRENRLLVTGAVYDLDDGRVEFDV